MFGSKTLELIGVSAPGDTAERFLMDGVWLHVTGDCQPYTRNLFRGFCYWKPHLKAGVPRFGSDLNVSSMLPHNSLHSVEAQASSLSNALGCEERLKYVRFYFG